MSFKLVVFALLVAVMDMYIARELNFLVICTVLFLLLQYDKAEVYKEALSLLWPILIISFIGILMGLINLERLNRDFQRDLFLFLSVIIYFLGGVLLSKYVKDFSTFFLHYSLIVVIPSIFHIILVFKNFGHYESLHQYREVTGTDNIKEAIFLSFFFARSLNKDLVKLLSKSTIFIHINTIIILVSFLLYFSRTMIITSAVLTLFLSNFINIRYFNSKRNKRLPYVIILLILFVSSSGIIASSLASSTYIATFFEKFERIPEEIFWRSENTYAASAEEINNNWRGYESSQGLKKFYNGNDLQKIVGYGFGSLVDLGLRIDLGGKEFEKVPILHNGYIFLLVKVGIGGLLFYLLFLYKLGCSRMQLIESKDTELYYLSQLLSGLAVIVLLNTFTVTGLFHGSATMPVMLGIIFGCLHRKKMYLLAGKQYSLA